MAGSPVLAPESHLATPVGGLERTSATAEVISVRGTAFARALRVRIGKAASDTNATQLTIRTAKPVGRGDAMLAIAFVRGSSAKPGAPAAAAGKGAAPAAAAGKAPAGGDAAGKKKG